MLTDKKCEEEEVSEEKTGGDHGSQMTQDTQPQQIPYP
jgi:hypothetical protein